jgi:hypothetical protein
LALTQRLELDRPVEWIGWWMRTPLEVCLEWNKRRARQVPELVVQQFGAALGVRDFQPDRSEGFAALVDYDPALGGDQAEELAAEIARLDKRISAARNREQAKEPGLPKSVSISPLAGLSASGLVSGSLSSPWPNPFAAQMSRTHRST